MEDIQKLDKEGLKILIIANKHDSFLAMDANAIAAKEKQYQLNGWHKIDALLKENYTLIDISAKDKTNIDTLTDALFKLVASGELDNSSTIVSNSRHYEALQKAFESLDSVLNGLEIGITGDFLAMDIRHALNYLGEIVGTISSDDLLGSIFSRFCIGK